jgi:hypothetical protein
MQPGAVLHDQAMDDGPLRVTNVLRMDLDDLLLQQRLLDLAQRCWITLCETKAVHCTKELVQRYGLRVHADVGTGEPSTTERRDAPERFLGAQEVLSLLLLSQHLVGLAAH